MKVINKAEKAQYDEMLARVQEQKPSSISVKQHPLGEEPKELSSGVIVVPGDYYSKEKGLVIAAADLEPNGAWEVV